jgi:hypothetical protein
VDSDKGGAAAAAIRQELLDADIRFRDMPYYKPAEQTLAYVFAQPPLMWVRARAFQQVTLGQLALRLLTHLPHYARHPHELQKGFRLPGASTEKGPSTPVRIYVCASNAGAGEVAAAVRAAAARPALLSVHSATELIATAGAGAANGVLLLYLTCDTFADGGGETAAQVGAGGEWGREEGRWDEGGARGGRRRGEDKGRGEGEGKAGGMNRCARATPVVRTRALAGIGWARAFA